MDRRRFLRLSAGGALAGAMAACGGSKSPATTAPEVTTSTTLPTTTTTDIPTSVDWQALAKKLSGQLVRPGDGNYATAAHLYDPTYDGLTPQGIAFCATPDDVVTCLAFVRDHGLQTAARSGGHSYAGWSSSTGLVVDVTEMSNIQVDTQASTATIGAGARLIDVYSELGAAGVALPAGSCPTVGIAGLTMGGGVGVLGRKFGLTCDNLLGADVVLATGEKVSCSATQHSDLFWALRGGGGGNFGVVTSFRFAVHPIADLALFTLVWPWSDGAKSIGAWLDWAPDAPDELWSNCQVVNDQNTPSGVGPAVRISGVFVGDTSALQPHLTSLIGAVGAQPFTNFSENAPYVHTMFVEAGCASDTDAECHLLTENPQGLLQRAPFGAKSDYLGEKLSADGIATVMAAVEARQTNPLLSGGGIVLDASGGAINRVAADATAFVHRDALASLQYAASWSTGAPASVVSANQMWLASTWTSMRPYVNGQAYQNYIDPALIGWAQAYYGSNLQRLEQVKRRYDPDNLFHFPQSIQPA